MTLSPGHEDDEHTREEDMPRRGFVVAVVVIFASLIVLGLTSSFLVDWAWFSAVGYLGVFWTILGGKAVLFFAVFAGSAALLWLNGYLAHRFARRQAYVRRLRADSPRGSNISRVVGADGPASSVASADRRGRRRARDPGCRRGGRQLGCVAAVRLSGALWTERSAVRQGHRLPSLLPSRLCRAQELAAADARLELPHRRSGLLGARRHRIRRAAPVDLSRGHLPWLGSAGALSRGESLVLWP